MSDGQVIIDILGEDKEYRQTVEALNAYTMKSVNATAKTMSAVGNGMTAAITAHILAVGAFSIKAAIDFESSFAGVRKTTEATETEFKQLAQDAKDMSETKVVSANQINDIMALGSQLGIYKGNLTSFASTIADLDVATNMNAEEAATQIAQYANITKMAQTDTDRFGSTIVELGNNMATTESDIMAFAMRIAGAGSQVGMTDAEILALSASLASVGISAEAGGTAISTIMSQIDKDVAQNSASLQTWAQAAGMSASDFSKAWNENAVGTLQKLLAGMESATASGGNMNLMLDELGVSSLRQTDVMKRMSSASELLGNSLDLANGAWQSNSALTKEAAARYMTTESQMAMLQNKMTNVASTLGGPLLGSVNAIIDGAEPFIAVLKDAATSFATMDEGQRNAIIGAALFAASLGPIAMAGSKLLTVTHGMAEGYNALKAAQAAAQAAQAAELAMKQEANVAALADLATKKQTTSMLAFNSEEHYRNTQAVIANMQANVARMNAERASAGTTGVNAAATAADTTAKVADAGATGVLTVAQHALNAAMKANPVGMVLTGVLLLVSAYAALSFAMSDNKKKTEKLTQASLKQKAVVDASRKSYDEAVKKHGEFSDAADSAKAALDRETEAFEASKESVEAANKRIRETIDSYGEFAEKLSETEDAAHSQVGALGTIRDSITELSKASDGSAESQAAIAVQITALEELYPGISGMLDANTLATDANSEAGQKMIATLNGLVEAERNRILQTDAQERYTELVKQSAPLLKAQADAYEELTAREAEYTASTLTADTATRMAASSHYRQSIELDKAQGLYDEATSAVEANARAMKEASDDAAAYAIRQNNVAAAAKEVTKGQKDLTAAAKEFGVTEEEVTAEIARAENEQAVAVITAKNAMTDAIDDYISKNSSFSRAMQAAGLDSETLANRLTAVGLSLDDVTANVMTAADAVEAGMKKMEMSTEVSAQSMIENMNSNTAFMTEYGNNLSVLMANAGTDAQRELISAIQAMDPAQGAAIAAQLAADINAGVDSQNLFNGMAESMQAEMEASSRTALEGAGVTIAEAVPDALDPSVDAAGEKGEETGKEFAGETSKGIQGGAGAIKVAAQSAVTAAIAATNTSGAYSIGTQMDAGITGGIYAGSGSVAAALSGVVRNAIYAAKAAADIHSPSDKTRKEIGQMLGKGATLGVLDEKKAFQAALVKTFDISDFSYDFSGVSQAAGTAVGSSVVNNYYTIDGISVNGNSRAENAIDVLIGLRRKGKM
jgi:TP901 family phage tail tape measure protein